VRALVGYGLPMRSRRLLVLPALLLLVGCGGADGSERIAASAQATLDAGTARFALSQEFTGGEQGTGSVAGEGELDFDNARGRVTTLLPGTEVESIFDGSVVFIRFPEGTAPTPWVRIDIEQAESIPELEQLGELSTDPSQNLAFLQGVSGEVEEVGQEEVRGVEATHYRMTVDLQQAADRAEEDARAYLQQQIEGLGVSELPTEVWLDGDSRIVRQTYTVDVSDTQVATTVEYFDFGSEVDVEPPAEAEVTDFAELLEAAPSEGG
jgi:hypothetical protein